MKVIQRASDELTVVKSVEDYFSGLITLGLAGVLLGSVWKYTDFPEDLTLAIVLCLLGGLCLAFAAHNLTSSRAFVFCRSSRLVTLSATHLGYLRHERRLEYESVSLRRMAGTYSKEVTVLIVSGRELDTQVVVESELKLGEFVFPQKAEGLARAIRDFMGPS